MEGENPNLFIIDYDINPFKYVRENDVCWNKLRMPCLNLFNKKYPEYRCHDISKRIQEQLSQIYKIRDDFGKMKNHKSLSLTNECCDDYYCPTVRFGHCVVEIIKYKYSRPPKLIKPKIDIMDDLPDLEYV